MNKNVIKCKDFTKRFKEVLKNKEDERARLIRESFVDKSPEDMSIELVSAFDMSGKMNLTIKEEASRNINVLLENNIAIFNSIPEDTKVQKIYFTDGEIYNYPRKPKN